MATYTITVMYRINGRIQHFHSRMLSFAEFSKAYAKVRRNGLMYDYKAEWEGEFYVTEFKGKSKRIPFSDQIIRILQPDDKP